MAHMTALRALALSAVLLCCPSVSSPEDPAFVPNGFGVGLDFVEKGAEQYMTPRERVVYTRGFVNGLFASGFLGAQTTQIRKLHSCLTGMTDVQVAAIIEKHIADNPKVWHQGLVIHGFVAIRKACGD